MTGVTRSDAATADRLDQRLHPRERPLAAQHEDLALAVVEQLLDQMAADEAGRAGDEVGAMDGGYSRSTWPSGRPPPNMISSHDGTDERPLRLASALLAASRRRGALGRRARRARAPPPPAPRPSSAKTSSRGRRRLAALRLPVSELDRLAASLTSSIASSPRGSSSSGTAESGGAAARSASGLGDRGVAGASPVSIRASSFSATTYLPGQVVGELGPSLVRCRRRTSATSAQRPSAWRQASHCDGLLVDGSAPKKTPATRRGPGGCRRPLRDGAPTPSGRCGRRGRARPGRVRRRP